jgi:hypothetical protein
VVARAKDVLAKLEKYELAVFADEKKTGLGAAVGKAAASQFSLFAISNENAIDRLREADVSRLSPDETKELLADIKQTIV